MEPITLGVLGGGLALRSLGMLRANAAQSEAEKANAMFYREQAEFARFSGERQQAIFDRESEVLFGEQESAFAKAGVDMASSSTFMAHQLLNRQTESWAIKMETDMNVRLATLRADQSEKEAAALNNPLTNALNIGGMALGTFKGVF